MKKVIATAGFAVLFGILAMTGCAPGGGGTTAGSAEAKWEGEAKSYAVYATQIPLYPGAKIDDVMGSDTYGDTPESHMKGMAWWYEVTATQAELDAWYTQRLSGTGYSKSNEDGTIVYTLTPQGAESGEEMGVYLEDNSLRVWERRKPGKGRS